MEREFLDFVIPIATTALTIAFIAACLTPLILWLTYGLNTAASSFILPPLGLLNGVVFGAGILSCIQVCSLFVYPFLLGSCLLSLYTVWRCYCYFNLAYDSYHNPDQSDT